MISKLISDSKAIEKVLSRFFQTNCPFSILQITGGGNNQVFLVKQENTSFVLKRYFQSKLDKRFRLSSEYQFLEYAWGLGIRNIPKPLMQFNAENIAIYSYIDGEAASISDIEINKALNFLLRLNPKQKNLHSLMPASESCFCFQDYLDTVHHKFLKLNSAAVNAKNGQLLDFLENLFLPKWEKVKAHFIAKHKNALNIKFPIDELCITPSDFGFHNAIVKENEIYFIDFEYAGVDDIAKTICDFFCQPKYPIPMGYLTSFVSTLLQLVENPIHCTRRINDLMPICQIKWCCIILNIFLNDGKKRRAFSDSPHKESSQLIKAINYLNNIQEEFSWPI